MQDELIIFFPESPDKLLHFFLFFNKFLSLVVFLFQLAGMLVKNVLEFILILHSLVLNFAEKCVYLIVLIELGR